MKKILFTNVGFKNYAGSEIATMTLANYFLRTNYEVHIFTIEYGEPLRKIVDKKIKVITLKNIEMLSDEYDLIWSHHFPLLDHILFCKKVHAKKIFFESLSYKLPIEAFPIYYKSLSLTGVVSPRVKKALADKGFDTSESYILPNYATQECFDIDYSHNSKVKKIIIVSNHLPNELNDFANIAANNGIEVDIFGMGYRVEFITPELLAQYDVVISIGKTIFYSLAIGIPSYTYDENVSIGYITMENIEENLKNNFANWNGYSPKKPEQIFSEIIGNYNKILQDSRPLKEFAFNTFRMDDLLNDICQKLEMAPEIDYEKLYEEYKTLEYTSSLYVEDLAFAKSEIMQWYNKSLELGTLYQEEIQKSVTYHSMYQQTHKELMAVLNSKGWKFLEKIRKIKK